MIDVQKPWNPPPVVNTIQKAATIADTAATSIDAAVTGDTPATDTDGAQKAAAITQLAGSIASLVPGVAGYVGVAEGLEPVVFHLVNALVHLFKHHAATVAAQPKAAAATA